MSWGFEAELLYVKPEGNNSPDRVLDIAESTNQASGLQRTDGVSELRNTAQRTFSGWAIAEASPSTKATPLVLRSRSATLTINISAFELTTANGYGSRLQNVVQDLAYEYFRSCIHQLHAQGRVPTASHRSKSKTSWNETASHHRDLRLSQLQSANASTVTPSQLI